MTTPTPLAEQIAREHSRVTAAGVCLCGAEGIGFEVGYAAHVATVTEQAVRERIAADLDAIQLPDDGEPDRTDAYWDGALDTHMWWQTKALNIARGGTR